MARFDRQIAMAQRLIQKNGQKVTYRRYPTPVNGNNEPWNGGTNAPTESDVFICFVPVRDKDTRKLIAAITGTEVEYGTLAGLMGQVPFTVSRNDVIVRNGKEIRIVNADILAPNEQQVLNILELVE